MVRVIVERVLDNPVTPEQVRASLPKASACHDAHRVRYLRSYVSLDGLRLICEYEAPDAESVRRSNQRAGLAYERVWTATIVEPEPAES